MSVGSRRAESIRSSACHRLNLFFYSDQFILNAGLEAIARYLQIPPKAIYNNLLSRGDLKYGTKRPINFQVMTHMRLPAGVDNYAVGVSVLPTYLVKPDTVRTFNDHYAAGMELVKEAVLAKQRCPLVAARQLPLRWSHEMMSLMKSVVDDRMQMPADASSSLQIVVRSRICFALYEVTRP